MKMFIVIQGISDVFQEDAVDVPDAVVNVAGFGTGASRSRRKLIAKVEQSEKKLDLAKRRMIGGSLTVTLIESGTVLSSLFSPRSRRSAFLNADETAATTTINCSSTTPFASSGSVFIGGETITYATKTGGGTPTLNTATRGAFGSEAQPHFGDATQGAGVFMTPPNWMGRRVKLVGYFANDDGTTTTALAQVLGTFRLEEAPAYLGDGKWELRCSDLSDEFAKRKLGSGLRDIEAEYLIDSGAFLYEVGADIDQFVIGGITTHLLATHGDKATALPIVAVSGTEVEIDIDISVNLITPYTLVGDGTIRHIAVLRDAAPGYLLVYALVSRLGNSANGSYDILPGNARDAFGYDGWRFGAGILAAEVDTASIIALGDLGIDWSFVIDDEIDLEAFLFDFCLATNTVWFVTAEGQLSVKRLNEYAAASMLTVDDDVIIGEPQVDYDEASIFPRVTLKCNYDPVDREFKATINLIDNELADRYPNNHDRLEIESRSLIVVDAASRPLVSPLRLVRPGLPFAAVEGMLRSVQQANGLGRCIVSLRTHLDALVLDLGDLVTLTVDVPDLEGAASITARICRVLSLGPDYDQGFVEMTLEVIDALFVIAPAAVIASIAGSTLTLAIGGVELATGRSTTPGRQFAANWQAVVRDVSGGTSEGVGILSSITDTTVTVGSLPGGFTIAAGDVLTIDTQSVNDGITDANADGYGVDDFTYQMPNDENDVDTSIGEFETRWR